MEGDWRQGRRRDHRDGVHRRDSRRVDQAHSRRASRRGRLADREPRPGFAEKHGIPKWFTDYHDLLALPEVDLVVLGLPNDLHGQVAVDAARARKHVVCEKPLCLNLAEADRMIDACRAEGVKLMYAEELCFAPKYVRAKQLVDEGALGKVYLVKQSEKHDGPHAAGSGTSSAPAAA